MEKPQMTRDELEAALRRVGIQVTKDRLDTLLPDARNSSEWLREILALDLEGHEPSTRFRPRGR